MNEILQKVISRINKADCLDFSYPYPNQGIARCRLGDGFYLKACSAIKRIHIVHGEDVLETFNEDEFDLILDAIKSRKEILNATKRAML